MTTAAQSQAGFKAQLKKFYGIYTLGFIGFVIVLAIAEQLGVPNKVLGYCFLFSTIGLYAVIGILSRTTDVSEYYVAGRKVPAFFNGMATGADWMSAASFIGMAGGLYVAGYDGLAFIMGWTGGYVLVALFLAPYLRKFGQFTIPDFLGARYGGNVARSIGVFAAILCSFTYVIAQIYGVGLITSRFTGIEFGVGVFVGLGGILVCSFLGGMRAVTWTQVAQYIILIVAYMIPVVWLSAKHTGVPVPQAAYGYVLQDVTELEKQITADPREIEVRQILKDKAAAAADKLKDSAAAFAALAPERTRLEGEVARLKAESAPADSVAAAEKQLAALPKDVAAAEAQWNKEKGLAARAVPPRPHAEAFFGKDDAARSTAMWNFLALTLCLMVGTAALPHILTRYYTTPSVREARNSVFWSLFFIFLLYFTAPALAVLVKFDLYSNVVGSSFAELPRWVANWAQVDPTLMSIKDLNGDGIVQLAEIVIGQDLVVLATPEIAGLPYVISGLVAAGGLAAALSTADGLLLTIANALSHDVYYRMVNPSASTTRRVAIAKGLLLVVALIAAYVTSFKPGNILFLVGAAFSLAASAFFPALVLGIFWKRATRAGAVAGMLAGLGTCMYYGVMTYPFFGINAPKWFGIDPISSGIFGIPAGFIVLIAVSLVTKPGSKEVEELIDHVRYPSLESDAAVGARHDVTAGSKPA